MAGERTEPATPQKLRKAREKGQVWQSRDLTSAFILLAAAALLTWQGPALVERLRAFMVAIFRSAFEPTPPSPERVLEAALTTIVECLAPFLATLVVVAVVATLLQVRPLFTSEPLKPNLSRLNPVSGFKRLFGVRGLVTALISIVKILLVGVVLVWTIVGDLRDLVLLAHAGPEGAAAAGGSILLTLVWRGAFLLLALSAIDALYQRYQYLKDQRMTKHEVKQEHKESEGDQSQKGERKRLHQELLEHAMIEQVRKANVVIVNPTHIAVALGYAPDEDEAPIVLASGKNVIARKIVEIARHSGIPVLQDVQLARSLVSVDVGAHIPEELYEAVAEILRAILDHDDLID